jgi:hypothetical protein
MKAIASYYVSNTHNVMSTFILVLLVFLVLLESAEGLPSNSEHVQYVWLQRLHVSGYASANLNL